jgi:hypothetical protein
MCQYSKIGDVGIQLGFLTILKMSLGIQKYTDFDRFVCGMDFEKLFS